MFRVFESYAGKLNWGLSFRVWYFRGLWHGASLEIVDSAFLYQRVLGSPMTWAKSRWPAFPPNQGPRGL